MMKFIIVACLMITLQSSWSDSPAFPVPKIVTSEYQRTFVKVIPEYLSEDKTKQAPQIAAYRLKDDGALEPLWEISGWYAFELYLSNDGQYLVRIGPWAKGCELSEDQLAVAFYKNGKELTRYSTKQLVKNAEKIQCTVSHYFWRDNHSEYPVLEFSNQFILRTIDGIEYIFDASTGKMLEAREF